MRQELLRTGLQGSELRVKGSVQLRQTTFIAPEKTSTSRSSFRAFWGPAQWHSAGAALAGLDDFNMYVHVRYRYRYGFDIDIDTEMDMDIVITISV